MAARVARRAAFGSSDPARLVVGLDGSGATYRARFVTVLDARALAVDFNAA